jgi:hypothetical protein
VHRAFGQQVQHCKRDSGLWQRSISRHGLVEIDYTSLDYPVEPGVAEYGRDRVWPAAEAEAESTYIRIQPAGEPTGRTHFEEGVMKTDAKRDKRQGGQPAQQPSTWPSQPTEPKQPGQ